MRYKAWFEGLVCNPLLSSFQNLNPSKPQTLRSAQKLLRAWDHREDHHLFLTRVPLHSQQHRIPALDASDLGYPAAPTGNLHGSTFQKKNGSLSHHPPHQHWTLFHDCLRSWSHKRIGKVLPKHFHQTFIAIISDWWSKTPVLKTPHENDMLVSGDRKRCFFGDLFVSFLFFSVWGTFPCYLLHFGAKTCGIGCYHSVSWFEVYLGLV